MAKKGIPALDGFALGSKSNLDKRKDVRDLNEMLSMSVDTIPEGFIVYIQAEDKYYKFSSQHTEDPVLGFWKETNITAHPEPRVENNTLIIS